MNKGSFSILRFYERRARRILPAACFVSLVTAFAAYEMFFPSELISFAKSLFASTFFLSNIYFYATTNYFSAPAIRLPLLHFWSLGVEEQFYFFFPLLVIATWRLWPRGLPIIIAAALVSSVLASGVFTEAHPTMAFYLLPFRAGELLIGSFIALPSTPAPSKAFIASLAVATGMTADLFAMFAFDHSTIFPGFSVLLPCVGTALIIWGGCKVETFPTKIIGGFPLRLIGKVSYSLYLVHWPIIVFGFQLLPNMEPLLRGLLLIVVSLVAAVFTLLVVEQPIRFNKFWSRNKVWTMSSAALLIPSLLAVFVVCQGGFPARFGKDVQKVLSNLTYNFNPQLRTGSCFMELNQPPTMFDPVLCLPTVGRTAIM